MGSTRTPLILRRCLLGMGLALLLAGCGGEGFTVPVAFPPSITAITPNQGPTTGGTPVSVTGTNFTSLTIVTIGGIPCLNVVVGSATSLTCQTPPGSQGLRDVTVSTTTGSDTLTDGFTYTVPPLTLAPGSRPVVDVLVSDAAGTVLHALLDVLNAESGDRGACGEEPLSALAEIAAGAARPKAIGDMAEAAGVFFGLESESGVLFWYDDVLSLALGGFPDGWCVDRRLRHAARIDARTR